MLKTELVAKVAEQTGLTARQAAEVVDSFTEQLTNAMARGEKVGLIGFGSFSIKHVAARNGRNPRTGEAMLIAAHNSPVFKAGSQLKAAVNSVPRGSVSRA